MVAITDVARQQRRQEAVADVKHEPTRTAVQRAHLTDESEEEPFIDTTEVLQLHSKRLERQQKRKKAKDVKVAEKKMLASLSRLPPELLLQVFDQLEPLDILSLQLVNRSFQSFVREYDASLAKPFLTQQYSILVQCFPRPMLLKSVDEPAKTILLNEVRQQKIRETQMDYEHLPVVDFKKYCTCTACVWAWNNLCLIIDYARWQKHLNRPRRPIPQIKRGSRPEWNEQLLESHAAVVDRATTSDLVYAAILQRHLASINDSIGRNRQRQSATDDEYLYSRTEMEAKSGNDHYLDRQGPHSREIPYDRSQYEWVAAYLPNRHWLKSDKRWAYYMKDQHQRDLNWMMTYHLKMSSRPS